MASKEITIEDLPSDILEEIFLFVSNRKILRRVCRKFKEIVDNSTRLMAKYTAKISHFSSSSIQTTICSFQALAFYDARINFDEFKSINAYKPKEKIKFIKIAPKSYAYAYKNPDLFAAFFQSILFNFSSLYELYLNLDNFYMNDEDGDDYYDSDRTLVSNELTNLQKLTITCVEERSIENVVHMFTNIQSIKSFSIFSINGADFYSSVWKLEELNVQYYDFLGGAERLERYKKFLISQKSTLRKFRSEEDISYFYDFIVTNLPDLETLHIDIISEENLNNDFLIFNDKLKSLAISNFDGNNERLENVLSSYINLERLMIKMTENDPKILEPIVRIELNNLTHLWLDGLLNNLLLNVKMPNLKFLEILNDENIDPYNFWRVPPENFKNLEKLSIAYVWRMRELHHVLLLCPKLIYLNLGHFKEYTGSLNSSTINVMLAHTHQLRYLGLLEENQNESREELQSQIHKKNIVVKFYDDFEEMMKDYWKIEHFGSQNSGMDLLI